MKKLLGLMGAFLLSTSAFAGVSGGVDLASEYLWRGASQSTGDDPVVQFNLEADWNGLYGGTWGSQVDFGDGKFIEYDFYGGYATSYKELTIDVGMIQYNYNKFIDESVEEWYAILGYKYISISYYKDMDNGESDYTEFSIDLPISDKLDVSARYGKLADGEDYQQLTIFTDGLISHTHYQEFEITDALGWRASLGSNYLPYQGMNINLGEVGPTLSKSWLEENDLDSRPQLGMFYYDEEQPPFLLWESVVGDSYEDFYIDLSSDKSEDFAQRFTPDVIQ